MAAQGVRASPQKQGVAELPFLYRRVLDSDAGNLGGVIRARTRLQLQVLLTVGNFAPCWAIAMEPRP